jgi:transposase
MVDYKRILQLKAAGVTQRGITEALGCSRNTVQLVLDRARDKAIEFEQVANLDAAEVRRLLLPEPVTKDSGYTAPDFDWVHNELATPNVSLRLLWNEYASSTRARDGIPVAYSTFTEQYRTWAAITGATMRIERKPGEVIEVDWAGDTMTYLDVHSGRASRAYLFVAALPYSAHFYVEAFADMRLAAWLDGHINAFEYFGGAARLLVPDNLKTGVTKADRYEPALNAAYAQMAEHYGTVIMPARVRKPRDKAMAENSVRFGANAIGAILRHRTFIGLGQLNEAIWEAAAEINAKPFQKREGSRLEVFEREEKALLLPLPPTRFEMATLKKAKVGPNYHVQVEGNFYSVPAVLIGKQLDVRITSRLVEIFDNGQRIATHTKAFGKGRYQTNTEHMPVNHKAQLQDWTPERFTNWAADIGPATTEVTQAILKSKKVVEQSYRSLLGLLSLVKKPGGSTRLEQSCQMALSISPAPSYTMVKNIWAEWKLTQPKSTSIGDAGFVRGASYYGGEEND